MKLRISGNSIRVRVNQTEAAALQSGKSVGQVTRFPGGEQLTVSVEPASAAPSAATLQAGHLLISLPRNQVHAWAISDQVSLQSELPLAGGESLVLLLEKDFACLHCPQADADAFPNPRAQAAPAKNQ